MMIGLLLFRTKGLRVFRKVSFFVTRTIGFRRMEELASECPAPLNCQGDHFIAPKLLTMKRVLTPRMAVLAGLEHAPIGYEAMFLW